MRKLKPTTVEITLQNRNGVSREVLRFMRRHLKAGREVVVIDGGGNTNICFPVHAMDYPPEKRSRRRA